MSYAGKDVKIAEDLWSRLRSALSTSTRTEWQLWAFSEQLILSDEWDSAIQTAIEEAALGLFAISNSFLISDYIRDRELPRFLQPDAGKRVAPIMLRPLPATADLRGLDARQIFEFHRPYSDCRGPGEREKWANRLADELHRVADRYGLGL